MTHDLLMMFSSVSFIPEVTGRIAASKDYGYAVHRYIALSLWVNA